MPWDEFWFGLPTTLAQSLISDWIRGGITLFVVSRVLVFVFRTLPSRLRWRTGLDWRSVFQPKPGPFIVLGIIKGETSHYKNLFTDMGQVRSTSFLAPSLNKAYRGGFKSASVIFSSDHLLSTLKERDIIAIGGQKNNTVSAELLDSINKRLGSKYGMKNFPSKMYKGQTVDVPVWAGKQMFSDEVEGVAYGMIIRSTGPGNETQTVTILAGAGTHGSEAAAWVLANDKALVKKIRWAGKNPEFLALVRADTISTPDGGEEIVRAELVEFATFKQLSR
jgi:hypothetical protein